MTIEERLSLLKHQMAAQIPTPTEYYTSRWSGEEIDKGIGGALQLGGATTPQAALRNIGGRPNRNLLDNWYFVGGGSQQGGGQFPINQRGQTSYEALGIAIDRWNLRNGVTLTLESVGIQISRIASSSIEMIAQFLPASSWTRIAGMPVTLSALINGKLGSVSFTFPTNMDALFDSPQIVVDNLLGDVYGTPNLNTCSVRFFSTEAAAWTIQAVKLELGNHQTLAYQDEDGAWQLFETPDYGEELAKCQRYFYKYVGNIFLCNYATGEGYASFEFPVEMRITPTVTIDSYNPDWGVPDARAINSHGLAFHSTSNGGIVTQFTASAEL